MHNNDKKSTPPSNANKPADAITMADTASTPGHFSTSRTVPGPGALPSRGLLALGKATLRMVETVAVKTRVQALSSKFPHRDGDNIKGIEQVYEDVMEFSRRDLYPDAVRTRALHMILVQIGSRQVEKLVQYLAVWSSVELGMFIAEIVALFDPIRLFQAVGHQPMLVQAYRNSLVGGFHSLEPLVAFFHRLTCTSDRIAVMVLEAGVAELIFRLHISNFFDPLVAAKATLPSGRRSALRVACETLLSTCSNTQRGLDIISKHRLHPLLPALLVSPFADPLLDRQTQRAEAWKSAEAEVALFRVQSIFEMMLVEHWQDQLTQESLEDIFADILLFYRSDIYHVRNHILKMFSRLIGSRNAKEIVRCVLMWPSAEIQSLISWFINTSNPPRSLDPTSIVLFINALALTNETAIQALLAAGSLDFLLDLYLGNFSDPDLPVVGGFRTMPDLRAICDSLLRTCLGTEQGLKLISEHQLRVIWPTFPTSPFTNNPFENRIIRADVWRSTKPIFIDLRLNSILDVVRAKPPYALEPYSIADIVEDTLEFFGHNQYSNAVKARALNVILALIGHRRTDELVDRLTDVSSVRIEPWHLITEIADIFNPRRLYTMVQADSLPISIQVYQGSLSASEAHSLQPLVAFFEKLAVWGSTSLQVAAIEFLYHICLSDFFDPLSATKSGHISRRLTVYAPCDSRLLSYINSRVEMGLGLLGGPTGASWSLQPPCVLPLEFPVRLAERARIWESTNTESILLRTHLISLMIPSIWQEATENRKSLVAILAISDLMEFLGSPSRAPDISHHALACFCRLLSFSLPFGSTVQAIYCDVALENTGHHSTLLARVFQQLLYRQRTLDTDDKASPLRRSEFEACEEDDSIFGTRGILQVIDFFVEAARSNKKFRNVILGANILGLLRPLLEQELRRGGEPIATHDRETLMVYDESDFEVLALIRKHGLKIGGLLPDVAEDDDLGSFRRAVLYHAFMVLL